MSTPLTTERIQFFYSTATGWRAEDDLESGDTDLSQHRETLNTEFQRWLTEHDRETKETAFRQGVLVALMEDGFTHEYATSRAANLNPYRSQP